MGSFMTDVGKVNIPEDRRDAYIREAKAVLKQSGLFERSYTQIFGHDVFLLSFPTFTGDYADFNYSYYEQRAWENAGIDLENCKPYSNKIGGRQFNLAIQALYALTEIYSDTLYAVIKDTLNTPVFSLFWLRYVLNRDDIQFTWRNTSIWDIYESMSLSSTYYPKRNTPKEFFNTLCGEDFLYNAICYFDISPEQVVTELNKLSPDIAKNLSDSFKACRESCRKCLSATLSSADFSDIFHDPEIEDILFYQIAHGLPIQ